MTIFDNQAFLRDTFFIFLIVSINSLDIIAEPYLYYRNPISEKEYVMGKENGFH